MNPQQLSAMDPKLREAYERVMGLAVAPKAAIPTPSTQAPSTPPIQNTMPPVIEKPLTQDLQPAPQSTPPIQTTTPIPATNIAPSIGENDSLNSFITQTPPTAPTPTIHTESRPNTESIQPQFDPVVANNQMHAYVSQEVAGVKQSLKIIQLIYIVGGLMFFGVYALFWMKFFNIPSPF